MIPSVAFIVSWKCKTYHNLSLHCRFGHNLNGIQDERHVTWRPINHVIGVAYLAPMHETHFFGKRSNIYSLVRSQGYLHV